MSCVCLFVSTIFNDGAYLTKSILYKALKDGYFAILQFEEFRTNMCFPCLMLKASTTDTIISRDH